MDTGMGTALAGASWPVWLTLPSSHSGFLPVLPLRSGQRGGAAGGGGAGAPVVAR